MRGGRRVVDGKHLTKVVQAAMAPVIALVDDLFFQAKMKETARQVGVDLRTVTTGDALLKETAGGVPSLVLVDLNAGQGAAIQALEKLRAAGNQIPVIAFLSHVQVELAERARAAGCQQVMPRSLFSQKLPAILAQAKT